MLWQKDFTDGMQAPLSKNPKKRAIMSSWEDEYQEEIKQPADMRTTTLEDCLQLLKYPVTLVKKPKC